MSSARVVISKRDLLLQPQVCEKCGNVFHFIIDHQGIGLDGKKYVQCPYCKYEFNFRK